MAALSREAIANTVLALLLLGVPLAAAASGESFYVTLATRIVILALAATGGVITSAGLVLAGTFSVLATLPLVSFAEIGFAVALGVLLDTIVVRSILVTALNLDLGPRIWWPHRYARTDGEPGAQSP